ncbi:MAG: iron uptake porin, partial [Waterburya sp.]
FNPIYLQGVLGAGATFVYKFNDTVNLSVGYLARNADLPSEDNGLFNGSYAALAQVAIAPSQNIDLGLTYVHAYYPQGKAFVSGVTGSRLANTPFGATATSADHFGLEFGYQISPDFVVSGWGGLTEAHAQTNGIGLGDIVVNDGDNATIFNWAVTLGFPDFLGSERSFAGLVIGQPPKVTSNDSGAEDEDTAWHLEASYRYKLNDNVTINPGLLVILNPEHDRDNDTIWVGTVRTVFNF